MPDAFNRWAQLVRSPGQVEIMSWYPIDVPPLGEHPPYSSTRPGIRLLVRPIAGDDLPWSIDITSTNVIAMLEGYLRQGRHIGLALSWSSAGFGVLRKDTIKLAPVRR